MENPGLGDRISDRVWQKVAENDPYWGVLSMDRFRGELSDERRAEFFASGEGAVAHMLDKATQIQPALRHEVAVDFGCGVGRLTRPLATRFNRVFAVDISPAMLELCAQNVGDAGAVATVLSDDSLSGLADVEADLIISSITFQHIRPRRGLILLEKLFERLRPGGVIACYLLVAGQGTVVERDVATSEIEAAAESLIEMNIYPMGSVLDLASRFATEVSLSLIPTGGHLGANFYARRDR